MMLQDATLRVDMRIRVGPLVVWLAVVTLVLVTLLSAVSPVFSASADDLWATGLWTTGDDDGALPQTW